MDVVAVCTCVVHKRCHQSIVTKCPGSKANADAEVSGLFRFLLFSHKSLCLRCFVNVKFLSYLPSVITVFRGTAHGYFIFSSYVCNVVYCTEVRLV